MYRLRTLTGMSTLLDWGLRGPARQPQDGRTSVAPERPLADATPGNPYYRLGATLDVVGALLLIAGTMAHPMVSDANNAADAFAAYAATTRPAWVLGHLAQLAGVGGMVVAMVLLAWAVAGTAATGSRLMSMCGAATVAVAAVLQAVDGIALKATVDLWSQAGPADRSSLFAAAQAVRQVEIGLDAVFSLALAATTLLFGLVLVRAPGGRRALGAVALATAATATAAGILFGLQGFSTTAMNMGAASGVLGIDLTITASVWGWRRASRRTA
jgi:hypothetical protein